MCLQTEHHLTLIFSEYYGIVAYQYNGWRFVEVVEYSKHAMGEGAINLKSTDIGKESFISKKHDLELCNNFYNELRKVLIKTFLFGILRLLN